MKINVLTTFLIRYISKSAVFNSVAAKVTSDAEFSGLAQEQVALRICCGQEIYSTRLDV